MRGVRALVATVPLLLGALTFPAGRAAAAPGCGPVPGPAVASATVPADGVPWPQRRYEPQRLAGIADGAGIAVAVLDSGVDAAIAPLRDRVLPGADELDGGDGRLDCVGHGTAVASIIAASTTGTGFAGLAPGARILPVRVTEAVDAGGAPTGRSGSVAGLVTVIRWSVAHGARVLNLSLVLYQDSPALREAISDALAHGVVVVAAVGNGHASHAGGSAGGDAGDAPGGDPVPYPAGYPGVIGVGAIGVDGQRSPTSPTGTFVDIVAPGGAVPAPTRGGQFANVDGTSFAAPFVAATAALILGREPGLRPEQVAARILDSADPSPDGPNSTGYGAGILNPYRAVTEVHPAAASTRPASAVPIAPRAAAVVSGAGRRAGVLAGAGAVLAGLVLLATLVLPRGARRGWRPGRS
jgi:membrane-anchored mycosin MYCP